MFVVFTLESAATEQDLAQVKDYFGAGNNIAVSEGYNMYVYLLEKNVRKGGERIPVVKFNVRIALY